MLSGRTKAKVTMAAPVVAFYDDNYVAPVSLSLEYKTLYTVFS